MAGLGRPDGGRRIRRVGVRSQAEIKRDTALPFSGGGGRRPAPSAPPPMPLPQMPTRAIAPPLTPSPEELPPTDEGMPEAAPVPSSGIGGFGGSGAGGSGGFGGVKSAAFDLRQGLGRRSPPTITSMLAGLRL